MTSALTPSDTGGGITKSSDWFYMNWEIDLPHLKNMHINSLESVSVLAALFRWAPQWVGCKVIIHTDNTTTMAAYNKGRCRDSFTMECMWTAFWITECFNIKLYSISNCAWNTYPVARMYMQTPSLASLPGVIIYTGCLCLREATHTLTTMQQIGCGTTAHLERQFPCVPGSTSGGITKELDKAVSHFATWPMRPLQKLPIALISKPSWNSATLQMLPLPQYPLRH